MKYTSKKLILGLIIGSVLMAFTVPFFSFAHPGNTASDGCHYCRTNCDKWGVSWNVRHCHAGGGSAPSSSGGSPWMWGLASAGAVGLLAYARRKE